MTARIPLARLERLAGVLNEFEGDPQMSGGQGVEITGDPAADARADMERVARWLMRFGDIDDGNHVPLGSPITIRPGEPVPQLVGLGEMMAAVAAQIVGDHLRRCDVCQGWMAARYKHKRRHQECHAKVFTREYHRERALARQAAREARKRTARRRPRR